jgi:hypothetical protein
MRESTRPRADIEAEVREVREQMAADEADDRPRLWLVPEDSWSQERCNIMRERVQRMATDHLVKIATDSQEPIDEQRIHALLAKCAPEDLD